MADDFLEKKSIFIHFIKPGHLSIANIQDVTFLVTKVKLGVFAINFIENESRYARSLIMYEITKSVKQKCPNDGTRDNIAIMPIKIII